MLHCMHGKLRSAGTWDQHFEGHRVGAVVKAVKPALYNSLASMSANLSELSKLGIDEAFAEGFCYYTKLGNNLFTRSISNYVDSDPAEVGALDLVVVTAGSGSDEN